jgi:hypothetical protein
MHSIEIADARARLKNTCSAASWLMKAIHSDDEIKALDSVFAIR